MRRIGHFDLKPILLTALLLVRGFAQEPSQPGPNLLQQHFEQGQKAIVENRYADAASALEKALALAPNIPELGASLGFSYFQLGRYQDAIPVLDKALKLKPELPNVDVLLAASLSEMGRFAEALPMLEKALPQAADPALKRLAGLQLQRCYTGLGRDREAVETSLALTKLYPEDPEVLYHAGRLFGNYAYLTFQKLTLSAPESVFARQTVGEAHESEGRYEQAIAEYRKVLELDPRRRGIHFRLGRALVRSSDEPDVIAKAMKEFEAELRADPTNANAAYELGELQRKQGDLEAAGRMFAQAVKYYPEFEQAQLGLGGVLTNLGRPAEAVSHLKAAIALNADSEVAYYRLAQAHRDLGQNDEMRQALADFQRVRSSQRPTTAAGAAQEQVTAQQVDAETTP